MSNIDEKLDRIAIDVAEIKTALWPDKGQPSRITQLEASVSALQGWRNVLTGAWLVVGAGLGFIARKH